ncbi:2'-phosphotransferase [Malassezia vespertilionis]|uniref:2'-phosphotransferase n=1 Tax=Malassezia vespertilionis TaxID=2020962 RepID=UPI0024B0DB78|nr:2'-phosphotransferase [Malassezia vespertilionis]WFD05484.1 2'-phosphotransferase [Malassezia vespertilionis]
MQEDAPLEPGSCVNASGDHAERSRDQARQWKKERKLQAQRKAEAGKQTDKEPSGKPKSARAIDPYVQLSKALAYLLRHGAEKEHLDVRDDGYIRADTVLLRPKIHKVLIPLQDGMRAPGLEDVRAIVDGNDKKRFELASGSETGPGEGPYTWIRAVQGHSLRQVTELDHTPLTLDNVDKYLACMDEMYYAIHGTDTDAWDAIQESGALRRMTRNHIHLARGLPGASGVISGAYAA